MTEILKNYQQCLTNPNGKIDFENDNLKTYLFLQRPLEHTPISIALLKEGFSREIIVTIMNIYLSHLEKKEIDKILSFDNYLTFKDRLFQIMKIRNLTAPKLYKKINMSQQTFNNVINSKALVSYNNALVLALGLELTFEQMIKFVNFARKGFGCNPQQDKFVKEAFKNKDYNI